MGRFKMNKKEKQKLTEISWDMSSRAIVARRKAYLAGKKHNKNKSQRLNSVARVWDKAAEMIKDYTINHDCPF